MGPHCVLAIVAALIGCANIPVDGRAISGTCTLTLTVDGEELTPPYRVQLSKVGDGIPDKLVNYDGDGWRGTVSMTTALPDGRIEEAGVEARTLNDGLIAAVLQQLGTFHVAFDDKRSCRQEFDLEVVPAG